MITDAGGTMLLPPGDVGPLGRLCVAADPTGAVFGVWQAGGHIGTELHSEPGGMTWEDLRTPDPDTAQGVLPAVFGYETHALETAGPGLRARSTCPATTGSARRHGPDVRRARGHPAALAGLLRRRRHRRGRWPRRSPPAAPSRCRAHDSPYGRMGSMMDPFGAVFTLVQTDGSSPPPER